MSSAIDYDFNKPKDIPIPAKMMNLHIPDRQSLYNCYMPFLEHGGLFIATNDKFSLLDSRKESCYFFMNIEKIFFGFLDFSWCVDEVANLVSRFLFCLP